MFRDYWRAFRPLFADYPKMWFYPFYFWGIMYWRALLPYANDDGLDGYRIQFLIVMPFLLLAIAIWRKYGMRPPTLEAVILICIVSLAGRSWLLVPTDMTSLFGPVPRYYYIGLAYEGILTDAVQWSITAALTLLCLNLRIQQEHGFYLDEA